MVSHKNNLFLILLGFLLIFSIFSSGKGTVNQISSSVPIPSVGLVATWVTESGNFNETLEIVNENSTYFTIEFYPNQTSSLTALVSKDVWKDFCFEFYYMGSTGWGGWISVDGLTVGDNVTLGDSSVEVIAIDELTIPLGTFSVFVLNTTDGYLYNYDINTGLLLGYSSSLGFHYLISTNGNLSVDTYHDEIEVPFVGLRAVYLYQDDNGTIILNETLMVTGENFSHYFVDMFTDGSLVDQSVVSKSIWMDRVFMWTYVTLGANLGWPVWINVTELTLGENITIGMGSFQVIDRVHISVPVGDFEVWNVSQPHENSTYWYELSSGLLIAYAFSDEYHYLDNTNALKKNETMTTVVSTTSPESTTTLTTTSTPETSTPSTDTTLITTEISTAEPETTDPLIDSFTTTSEEESTTSELDTTTKDGGSSTTQDTTAPSISPGFSLPVVLATFGMLYWIYTSRRRQ